MCVCLLCIQVILVWVVFLLKFVKTPWKRLVNHVYRFSKWFFSCCLIPLYYEKFQIQRSWREIVQWTFINSILDSSVGNSLLYCIHFITHTSWMMLLTLKNVLNEWLLNFCWDIVVWMTFLVQSVSLFWTTWPYLRNKCLCWKRWQLYFNF